MSSSHELSCCKSGGRDTSFLLVGGSS